MNNISKLGEDIEKRLQGIEKTQDEYNKIIIELDNRITMLQRTVDNTHKTFNLLLENINNKNQHIDRKQGKFKDSSESDSSTDSDSSIEQKRKTKDKNKNKTKRVPIRSNQKSSINASRRIF